MKTKKNIFVDTTFRNCMSILFYTSKIRDLLSMNGYNLVDSPDVADTIMLAGCAATDSIEGDFFKTYNGFKEKYPNKKMIPFGCIASYKKMKDGIGPKEIERLKEFFRINVEKTEISVLDPKISEGSDCIRGVKNHYIQISQGCANRCSYCSIKKAKGFVCSEKPAEILERVIRLKNDGATRFMLLSDDCGSYGIDLGISIVDLLNELAEIDGCLFALSFFEPARLSEVFEKIKFSFWRKLFFINVPLQTVSVRLLRLMNRRYEVGAIRQIAKKMKEINPHVTIATHLMFALPTESKIEFRQLLNWDYSPFKPISFFLFSPRPGTKMGKMEQLDEKERLRRANAIEKFVGLHDGFDYIFESELKNGRN